MSTSDQDELVKRLYEAILEDVERRRGSPLANVPEELLSVLCEWGDAAVEYLIQLMAMDWPWYRRVGHWFAARIDRMAPRLLELLADRMAKVELRSGAAFAFGVARAEVAVPALREALREGAVVELEYSFAMLLYEATRALAAIGEASRAAVPELLALFDDPRTKAWDLTTYPFGPPYLRPGILEALVAIDGDNVEVIERVQRSFYDEDAELFSVAPKLLVRSGARREAVRQCLKDALQEDFYSAEREAHIHEAWMQEGTAKEYFRSTVLHALELLDAGESTSMH